MTTYYMPYIIYGYFYDRSGNKVLNGYVTAKNVITGDIITTTTNAQGAFAIDCSNFTNGYDNLDTIRLSGTSNSAIDYDLFFSVDAGKTWQQVDNSITSTLSINTTRIKLNTTSHPGGRTDLNITLIA